VDHRLAGMKKTSFALNLHCMCTKHSGRRAVVGTGWADFRPSWGQACAARRGGLGAPWDWVIL
jgi:hypothetical protein